MNSEAEEMQSSELGFWEDLIVRELQRRTPKTEIQAKPDDEYLLSQLRALDSRNPNDDGQGGCVLFMSSGRMGDCSRPMAMRTGKMRF